jgi:hypothetical protein
VFYVNFTRENVGPIKWYNAFILIRSNLAFYFMFYVKKYTRIKKFYVNF